MLLKVKRGLSLGVGNSCASPAGVRPAADEEGQVGSRLGWPWDMGWHLAQAREPGQLYLPARALIFGSFSLRSEARAYILRSPRGVVTLLSPGGLGPILVDVGETQASLLLSLL